MTNYHYFYLPNVIQCNIIKKQFKNTVNFRNNTILDNIIMINGKNNISMLFLQIFILYKL